MELPSSFIKTLHDIHEDAAPWLESLPSLLDTLEKRWSIRTFRDTAKLPRLSYNVVMFAEGIDGTPYVLKMSPISDEFTREIAAIKVYNGQGIARLIQSDETIAAMLLERLEPGVSLWTMPDNEATHITASLLKKLWRPVNEPHDFRTLESWAQALLDYRGSELPKVYVDKARGLLRELLPTPEPVLLHGDLHHDNILSATREPYLAIDPKGLVGNKVYDLAPSLVNPDAPVLATKPELQKILERRIAIFSELLGFDRREITTWGFVHTLLATIWTIEDHGEGWQSGLVIAKSFDRLL
jgi:streptomycin 6-kinase